MEPNGVRQGQLHCRLGFPVRRVRTRVRVLRWKGALTEEDASLGAVADLEIDSWAHCEVPRHESICFWRRFVLQGTCDAQFIVYIARKYHSPR